MRIYVAASSAEVERVRWAMDAVRALGCEVYDWRVGHRPTEDLTREERRAAAYADLAEIRRPTVLWCLAPSGRSDARVELGYALAMTVMGERPHEVIVSGQLRSRGIFASLAREYDSDAEALAEIAALADRHRALQGAR